MGSISRRRFCGTAATVGAAAVFGAALAGCSSGQASSSSSSQASSADSGEEPEFMSQGRGEHLDIAVTGKLIKIAPAIIANKKGYFDDEKCDVTFQTIALADAIASMSTNKLDVDLFGIVPTASYIAQGSELYIIGGTVLNGGEILSLDAFDRDLTQLDSWKGLKVACSREETGQMWLKNFLKNKGLDIDGGDVTFEYVDNSTTALEGLRSKQDDLFITPNAMGYTLARDGIKVDNWVDKIVGDYPCCRHNVSAKAFKEKFLSLVDMETAILRGYAYLMNKKNRDDVIDMMVDYSAQQADYVEAAFWGKGKYVADQVLSPDPYVNACKQFYEAMKSIGEIDANTPYTMDDYATPVVYRKALDACLKRYPNEQVYKDLDSVYSAHNE